MNFLLAAPPISSGVTFNHYYLLGFGSVEKQSTQIAKKTKKFKEFD
jgi:hypothetical protein